MAQVVVLVGATGDLSRRKLLPGSFHLVSSGFIPGCRIIGVSRDEIPIVGAGGGFLDAVGGGGWGPLVASTLMASGDNPRRTIGSVNLAEFLVILSISAAFLMQLDFASYGELALELIIGGAIAAPLAGCLLRILPTRVVLALAGIVVAGLSLINLASRLM